MARFQEQVDSERPGHMWRAEGGKIFYAEDDAMEKHLGRKLTKNETVIHKNDIPSDNSIGNLELVEMPDLGGK
jgi:hypothetical protein